MEEDNCRLFVYGTLLNEGNEFAVYLKQHCVFYSKGEFRGKLYDIGEYPGAMLSSESDHFVYGSIYIVDDQKSVFKILDDYEGFGDDQPYPNEFIREIIEIETQEGSVLCRVYLYNLPVDGFRLIKSGNYLE